MASRHQRFAADVIVAVARLLATMSLRKYGRTSLTSSDTIVVWVMWHGTAAELQIL
jgi:hypothetical protein